ncbi:HypC/HybG/HupF family hydrogenase formation chaperone [Pseudaquidulcibacter saccharophilus]|uniref:HypC/HybG/HupF family hydrogenase formation chaperone n=1 Tax=Pseudaquidulcibacter saccharophilus TaxID=2831900 RepID=UPI001EFF02EE|nr:HypC/HybG/HupF family hydrogenase formation chaperone [Pseudaquidulcibacter saccharophilus]
MCVGIPGQIKSIKDHAKSIAIVEFSGELREIDLTCVADDNLDKLIGQWVLIHLGFAMDLIDEDEARETLAAFKELDAINQSL